MEKGKKKKVGHKIIAYLLAMVFMINVPIQKVQAEEKTCVETNMLRVITSNDGGEYGVRPLTTLVDCEIIMAFSATEGLVMTFSTSCVGEASVLGVKDIKIQQKMWYGWKTVATSEGTESYNCTLFAADVIYPDAIKDKTYRVIATHYGNVDGYEEAVNDTGAFKYTY